MSHPDDGYLQAWLDGELPPERETGVREHLTACAQCSARIDVLRGEAERFSRAVLAMDEQAGAPADPGPLPLAHARAGLPRRRIRYTGWSLGRAAALLLLAAGAAAALVPGSPVREWLVGSDSSAPATARVPAVPEPGGLGGGEVVRGPAAISVQPLEGRLTISLRGFPRNGNVHVRLTEAERASVRVEGAAAGPRFVTGPGTLEVIGSEEGEIWVELPRSAGEAVVLVDGDAAVRVEGGQLVILWPAADSLSGEVVLRIGG